MNKNKQTVSSELCVVHRANITSLLDTVLRQVQKELVEIDLRIKRSDIAEEGK